MSVPAEIVCVFVSVVNDTPTRSTVPCPARFNPYTGAGGTSLSTPPPAAPPICHRVSGFNSGPLSMFNAFEDLPEISTVAPVWFGTSITTGLVDPNPPNFQVASAIVKKLVESGTTVHGGATVIVVPVFEITARSCAA